MSYDSTPRHGGERRAAIQVKFLVKSSQVKFLLSTQIQNSPPLVPGAGSLRRRQNLNHPVQTILLRKHRPSCRLGKPENQSRERDFRGVAARLHLVPFIHSLTYLSNSYSAVTFIGSISRGRQPERSERKERSKRRERSNTRTHSTCALKYCRYVRAHAHICK